MLSHVLHGPAVLIGDLVESRRAPDRRYLHSVLLDALRTANARTNPAVRLAPTVGDEFQGVFHSLVDAVLATLLIRTTMRGHDARFGLGVGQTVVLDRRGDDVQQDGPGWWAARDAIEFVASGRTSRYVPATLRTWVMKADSDARWTQPQLPGVGREPDPGVRAVNAYLVSRDHLVSKMDERDRRILHGLLLARSLTEIAEAEGVSVSAVSQRSRRSGAAQIAFAQETLR